MMRRQSEMSELRRIAESSETREVRARRIAELIREAGGYRWVGIYDVTSNEIAAIAWSGRGDPAFPRFPVTQGLNGAAVSSGKTVIVGDVMQDVRYLTTLGNTRSEMVVPVRNESGAIVGTIDVESEKANAFSARDRDFLEECGRAARPLWIRE